MGEQMAGNWFITPLDSSAMTTLGLDGGHPWELAHTEVEVRDRRMWFSGGQRGQHGTNPMVSTPMNFYRGSDGVLYTDNAGSLLTTADFANGEFKLSNFLNMNCLCRRGWKRDGHSAPPA